MFDVWRLVSSAAQFGWFHDKAYLARSTVWFYDKAWLARSTLWLALQHSLVGSIAQFGQLYSRPRLRWFCHLHL